MAGQTNDRRPCEDAGQPQTKHGLAVKHAHQRWITDVSALRPRPCTVIAAGRSNARKLEWRTLGLLLDKGHESNLGPVARALRPRLPRRFAPRNDSTNPFTRLPCSTMSFCSTNLAMRLPPHQPRAASAVMVLLASCLAMLGIGINSTAIMAALPTMRTEFGLGEIGTQWTINAYLVVSASCIVLGGKAADLFGARHGIDGRPGTVRCRVLRDRACEQRECVAGGASAAGSLGRLRGSLHARRGRHQRGTATPSGIDWCLERILDAGFQYRPAVRRPAHPHGELARDILAEHTTDVRRDRRSCGRPFGRHASRSVRRAEPSTGWVSCCWPRPWYRRSWHSRVCRRLRRRR